MRACFRRTPSESPGADADACGAARRPVAVPLAAAGARLDEGFVDATVSDT
jgi:hypothetical protein